MRNEMKIYEKVFMRYGDLKKKKGMKTEIYFLFFKPQSNLIIKFQFFISPFTSPQPFLSDDGRL